MLYKKKTSKENCLVLAKKLKGKKKKGVLKIFCFTLKFPGRNLCKY